MMELTDHEILRYNRQIVLKSVDFEGQEKLKASRVLVVGLGGLGCAASQYLASGGVGHLTLVDFDTVSLSNLQRQILHTEQNLNEPKVFSAQKRLAQLNPHIKIDTIYAKLTAEQWEEQISKHDLVLDCTDNADIRNLLNLHCYKQKRPLVSGAAIRFEGQISVFRYKQDEPCYQCLSQLFGENILSCVEAGVISPIVGVIGSLQALETMKVLMDIGTTLSGKLLIIDGLNFSVREMKLPPSPTCSICANDKNREN